MEIVDIKILDDNHLKIEIKITTNLNTLIGIIELLDGCRAFMVKSASYKGKTNVKEG